MIKFQMGIGDLCRALHVPRGLYFYRIEYPYLYLFRRYAETQFDCPSEDEKPTYSYNFGEIEKDRVNESIGFHTV